MIIIREETHTLIVKKTYNLTDEQMKSIFPEYSEESIRDILVEGENNGLHDDVIDKMDDAIMEGEIEPEEEESDCVSASHGGFPIDYRIQND